jgi:uncharacterized protein (DUF2147 family)
MIAATPASSNARARSVASTSVSSAQPRVATRPARASMPTATRPGRRGRPRAPGPGLDRDGAEDHAGEALRQPASIVAMSRMPPPSWQGTSTAARIASTAPALTGAPGEGAVEIDQMQPFAARVGEGAGLRRRIVAEDGGAIHRAAQQPHALAVLQVDRGIEDHRRTEPGARDGVSTIRIMDCDDRICGQLVAAYDDQGRPLESPHVGRTYLWDMEPRGSGRYRNGRLWLPERDQDYRARMLLAGDRLTVTHCTMIMGCRDQVWTRLD